MGACSDGGLPTVLLATTAAALLVLLPLGCEAASGCKVKVCSRSYARSVESDSVSRGPTYRYCTILRSYADCINITARSCRGDLEYHSITSLVMQWINNFDCASVIARGPQQEYNDYTPPSGNGHKQHKSSRLNPPPAPPAQPAPHHPPAVLSPMSECMSYRPSSGSGSTTFSHCGLFGDPHLRTFYNELQTCRVKGAWPLIDNPHLAVQVTNDAVVKGSSATATSKITVVVRSNGPCSMEKTFEAQTDFLPSVFVDGSKTGGPGVRIKEESPGRHVEIHLRHIGTRIVIRQVGRYLTFAIRIPMEIAIQGASQSGNTLELCVRGCPKRERIDFNQLLSQPDSFISMVTNRGHVAIPKKEALATCRQYNVTDFYFDACVFDLLTTGDSTFSMAAREAMHDVLTLYPASASSRQNRTVLLNQPPPATGSQNSQKGFVLQENSAPGRPSPMLLLLALLLALLLFIRRNGRSL